MLSVRSGAFIIRQWILFSLLLLLCTACAAPVHKEPPRSETPPAPVESERRVFVPARPTPPPPTARPEDAPSDRPSPPPEISAEPHPPPIPPHEPVPPEQPAEPLPIPTLSEARDRERRGDLGAAEQAYRHLIDRGGPAAETARTELAFLLSRRGRYREVLSLLRPLGPAAPSEQWLLRAEAHEMAGLPVEAVWDYSDAARRSDPHTAEELRGRVRHLLERLSPWELQDVATRCPFCPEGGYARLRLARLDLQAGRTEPAEEELRDLSGDFAGDPLGRAAARHLAELEARRAIEPGLYGVLLPLSGPLEPFGRRALRGILLGSGLFSEQDRPAPALRLRIHDTRGDPSEAARGVETLAREGVVGIIGPLKGDAARHAALAARRLDVPLLTLTPSSGISGDGVFRIYLREEDEVARLVEFAMEERDLERFAILYPDQEKGRRYRDLFWDAVVARGGEITGVEAFPAEHPGKETGDAIRRLTGVYGLSRAEIRERFIAHERQRLRRERELLEALEVFDPEGGESAPDSGAGPAQHPQPPDPESEPEPVPEAIEIDPERLAAFSPRPIVDFDAVFLPASSLTAAQMAPLFPFHDVEDVTLLGVRSWHYPTLIEVGEEYVEGVLFPGEFHPEAPGSQVFFQAYRDTYGEDPGGIDAYAYDAVNQVRSFRDELQEAETRPQLERNLRSVWADAGATGPLTSHPDGDIAAQPKILTVDQGRFRLVR